MRPCKHCSAVTRTELWDPASLTNPSPCPTWLLGHEPQHTGPSRAVGSHLVGVHVVVMWEVEEGDENPDTVTLQPVPVQVTGHHPSHKVLPCARPAMEGQDEGLPGPWALQEPPHCPHHHFLGQVLPVELPIEVCLQPCTERAQAQPSTASTATAGGNKGRKRGRAAWLRGLRSGIKATDACALPTSASGPKKTKIFH